MATSLKGIFKYFEIQVAIVKSPQHRSIDLISLIHSVVRSYHPDITELMFTIKTWYKQTTPLIWTKYVFVKTPK